MCGFKTLKPCCALQILHSIGKERLELVNSMTDHVVERVLPLLKPVDKCWQPADFLPQSGSDTFLDEVRLRVFRMGLGLQGGRCLLRRREHDWRQNRHRGG